MTQEIATPTAQGQKPKAQGQGPSYVGQGSYTANMLGSWSSIEKRLIAHGHDQENLDLIYAVAICPKGHDNHMNLSAAAAKFFPNMSPITAKCRVLTTTLYFMQQVFVGQHVAEYQAKWDETHAKPVSTGTRARLTSEIKAERTCTKALKNAFREQNHVGGRGRLQPEMQEKMDRFMEKHLPAAIAKEVAELDAAKEDKA